MAFSPEGKTIVSRSWDKMIKVWDAGTLDLVEQRAGDGVAFDRGTSEVAERDGAMLRLKEGGAFYAPSPLSCVAVSWPSLVAGAQSGELYQLRVERTICWTPEAHVKCFAVFVQCFLSEPNTQ